MSNNKYIRAFYSLNRSVKCIIITILGLALSAAPSFAAQTANLPGLQTWWHNNYELNSTTPVLDTNVRRSPVYDVKVYPLLDTNKYDSYVYMSVPRGGREKWGYDHDDGAEFADLANLTMSWSSFIYNATMWVEVTLKDGQTISSLNDVVIRPTTLNFEKQLLSNTSLRIKVPYAAAGYRFSVEFNNQLITSYNDMAGDSGKLTTVATNNRAIHTEPKNALLIFAEPKLADEKLDKYVPKGSDGTIYYVPPGRVGNLDTITEQIIYFRPGTYYMDWNYHARLPANVKWVYFAPGAFVKGAFQFLEDTQLAYKVTGYGVLSGEKYVYEADADFNEKVTPPDQRYFHRSHLTKSDCHGTCVKMLQFKSSAAPQTLDLQGVTIVEPPYHSFVVYGFEDTFKMNVENYKQVGGWYWQTDGLELYKYSSMVNSFLHSNDDVLKIYHSGVKVDNTVIWKNENGPVIQFGWTPRDIDSVTINNTQVIHNRMAWEDIKGNTCVINSSPHYLDPFSKKLADPTKFIELVKITGLRVEGKTNCAIRWYALSSLEDILIKDFYIEGWNSLDIASQASEFKRFSNANDQKISVGNEANGGYGVRLENYKVGNEYISRAADNWRSNAQGRLNFDGELWDNWDAVTTAPQTCAIQTINFPDIADQTYGASLGLNATASSGLGITYQVEAGNASLSANQLSLGYREEQIRVVAIQAGNRSYCSASAVKTFNLWDPMRSTAIWVAGTFSGWALKSMDYQNGNLEFTAAMSAGAHELKFANSGNWSGKDWGNTSGLSGYASESTGGLPNVTFSVAVSGNYKIRFNPVTLFYAIELVP